ncbi:MAG: hypothetical protein J6L88_03475, partial [Clostridia bacterium]|nr:hypothetical protein [Clostridia bacterium]
MPDLQNETEFQDDFYTPQQQYIDEELSFLTQAREQMRSYNEQFSTKGMEESFLQSITPPDPFEELYAHIEEDVPQTEEQAEP